MGKGVFVGIGVVVMGGMVVAVIFGKKRKEE